MVGNTCANWAAMSPRDVTGKNHSFCDLKCCLHIDERAGTHWKNKTKTHLLNVIRSGLLQLQHKRTAASAPRAHQPPPFVTTDSAQSWWQPSRSSDTEMTLRSSVSASQPFSKPSGWMVCFCSREISNHEARKAEPFCSEYSCTSQDESCKAWNDHAVGTECTGCDKCC